MTRTTMFGGAAAAMMLALAPAAHAQGADDPAEAKAFLSAGMTLPQAVAAAEATGDGTAMSATWEPQGSAGAMGFEVELAKADGTVTTVVVDPASGSVSPRLAKADRHGEDDDEDRAEGDREGDDDAN